MEKTKEYKEFEFRMQRWIERLQFVRDRTGHLLIVYPAKNYNGYNVLSRSFYDV